MCPGNRGLACHRLAREERDDDRSSPFWGARVRTEHPLRDHVTRRCRARLVRAVGRVDREVRRFDTAGIADIHDDSGLNAVSAHARDRLAWLCRDAKKRQQPKDQFRHGADTTDRGSSARPPWRPAAASPRVRATRRTARSRSRRPAASPVSGRVTGYRAGVERRSPAGDASSWVHWADASASSGSRSTRAGGPVRRRGAGARQGRHPSTARRVAADRS